MSETAQQYQARLAAYTEGRDPIAMQREAPGTLLRLIENALHADLYRSPAPGKWSVTEILAHLAEDELTSTWRYRQMLEYEDPELAGFDQNLWAQVGDYSAWNTLEALDMFRLLRQANLRMFARLTSEQWRRGGIHPERGEMTVESLCRHMAAHDVNHIEQVRKILAR